MPKISVFNNQHTVLYSQINRNNCTIVLIVCISHCTVRCGYDGSVGGVMTHPLNEPGVKLIEIGMRWLQQVEVELTQSKEENQLLYIEKQNQASRFCQLQQLLQNSQERATGSRERKSSSSIGSGNTTTCFYPLQNMVNHDSVWVTQNVVIVVPTWNLRKLRIVQCKEPGAQKSVLNLDLDQIPKRQTS